MQAKKIPLIVTAFLFVIGNSALVLAQDNSGSTNSGGTTASAGQKAGQSAGQKAGQSAGQKAGQSAGQKAGQSAGQKAGQSAGQKAGQSAGQKAGQKAGTTSTTTSSGY